MDKTSLNILMAASECRGIAKAGGLGDVVYDLSNSLRKNGIKVSIIIPFYEIVKLDSVFLDEFKIEFGMINYKLSLYKTLLNGVDVYLLKNQNFFSGETGNIYIDSDRYKRGPFEDDARRFAFFSKCVCELLLKCSIFKDINILHCHDWHTGLIPTLLNFESDYKTLLSRLRTIFTIHNLDYQGVRPFYDIQYNELTSFETWFPDLYNNIHKNRVMKLIKDPKIFNPCFNPMRAGINLSDFVNTVSPSYAIEITKKDNMKKNFFGGRGLEKDLQKLYKSNKLKGILNGIDYDEINPGKLNPPFEVDSSDCFFNKQKHKIDLISNLDVYLKNIYEKVNYRFVNWERINKKIMSYSKEKFLNMPLFVTVSRAVTQKLGIMMEKFHKDTLINEIAEKKMFLIIIGTGELQEKLEILNNYENVFYIAAFDQSFADKLYCSSDFFLMPSYFEPCGISQMIALRYGSLPIVNQIGGLKDTIRNLSNGFVFKGDNKDKIKQSFIDCITNAIDIYYNDKKKFQEMQITAMNERYSWDKSVEDYLNIYK